MGNKNSNMVPDMTSVALGEMFEFSFFPDPGESVNEDFETLLKDDPEFAQWINERDAAALAFQMSCVTFDTEYPCEYED